MSELSRRSGVGIPMIKFYLREGMLPAGERGAPNQADYGEDHVHRLRLLRALTEEGALSSTAIKQVLAAVDDDRPLAETLGVTQDAVVLAPELDDDDGPAEQLVGDLVARRNWRVDPDNPGYRAAARILTTAHRIGFGALPGLLDAYADAVEAVAADELAAFVDAGEHVDEPRPGREADLEAAVTGIVLGERMLSALRTMAHQHVTLQRFASTAPSPITRVAPAAPGSSC